MRSESQGLGSTGAGEGPPDALGALSASAVTEHGEPVGTRSAVYYLCAALDALGRNGNPTADRLQEIEGLIRHALRALGDARAQ